ncbi:MAG: hypothetical protein Q8L48_03805 [Archangium sp.]|nr:hypothetical protein [Archangium sp.]
MSLRWSLLLVCSCVGTADMVGPPEVAPAAVTVDGGAAVDAGVSVAQDSGVVDAGTPPVIDAGFDAGPPPACGALDTRLISATIDVGPASVDVGSSYGWSNNRPVHLVGLADGTARAAWSGGGQVHVTPLSASLQRAGPDVIIAGESVRGFVAHDDGTAALLVVRGTGMFLVKLRADGTALFETAVVNDQPSEVEGARWVDSWGHEGRLLFTGTVYVAYFGHTKHWGAMGKHQGDLLISLDATTGQPTGGPAGWAWGCSHSLDVRLAWDGASIAPVCLSDCYRAKAVMLNDSDVLQDEPGGNCAGSSPGELGGLASLGGGGFGFTFSTKEGRASRDVGFIAIDAQQRKSPVVWLTSAAGDESAPHLARYGAGGLLASWREGSASKLAVLSPAGVVVEGPITAPVGVADRDDFTRWPSGDVGWAEGAGRMLRVSRVRACSP